MKCIILFALLLAVCNAQVPSFGWCPDYVPMSNFDMERFLGKWYEAERYFQVSELGTRCVVSDYAKSANGKIYVSNEVTSRITGVKRILGGDLELVGRAGEGKLKVRYQTTPIASTSTISVLDTDYENYAVLWSCSGYGPVHTQNAWVMTRERLPPGTIMQKAYGVLDRYKISRTFFQRTDQEGCIIAASEINAAQGLVGEQTIPEEIQSVEKYSEDYVQEKSAGPIAEKSANLIEEKIPELDSLSMKKEEVKPVIKKEEKLPQKEEKLPLKEEKLEKTELKKEKIKKPVKVAEHILKNSPVEAALKPEEVKKEQLAEVKPETESIPEKLPEIKKIAPKVGHSQKNIAKTK
ncbi:hypothetical protein HHI36_023542 [Cryptolaemus montrouzieri]|uniref:Lipocalin/cytosolic fatty-acid binding domain-containing protein n=1 Tax=Cryptolaemus montrouzieri TaxID=559131 RepID=A0ABD2PGU9_9CUCU